MPKPTASSNARPFAINVAEVTTPRSCASTMAQFTPDVSPKSSALMIRRRTAQSSKERIGEVRLRVACNNAKTEFRRSSAAWCQFEIVAFYLGVILNGLHAVKSLR